MILEQDYCQNIIDTWLYNYESTTSRGYASIIRHFLLTTHCTLDKFLTYQKREAFNIILGYKAKMIKDGLTPSNINRRLAAIKSLINYCFECGLIDYDLKAIKGIKRKAYRDTTGINLEQFKTVLICCDLTNILGLRDYAILLLLWTNALRRAEVSNLKINDLDIQGKRLRIMGKGKREYEWISLSEKTLMAIQGYLNLRDDNFPGLFISHHPGYFGYTLCDESISKIVKKYCSLAGIEKIMSPMRIRHSSITTALDLSDGNVRKVQQLSRHSSLNTLMIYDDNRQNFQEKISCLLSNNL